MINKIVVIIILIIISILVIGFLYWQNLNSPVDANSKEQVFIVNKGETIKQIADNLKKESLIRSAFYFKYNIWKNKLNIKAGEYLISSKLSAKEIIKILTAGNALSKEKSITIIEGWDINDISNYFEKNNYFLNNNFADLAKNKLSHWRFKTPKPDFLKQAPASADLEGFLFPDTYRLFQDAVVEDAIIKMLNNFGNKLTLQMRQDIVNQDKTIFQIITMASLVEKEVRSISDMQIVSGIFWNRIKNNQALQSCATLAYVLGEKKLQYSIEDTKINSPYNTYQNLGLPPGPIANAGLNAIKAAIYPKYTDYNYFLSRPDTGETVFSKNFEEHNKNKAKYLK